MEKKLIKKYKLVKYKLVRYKNVDKGIREKGGWV